MQITANKEGIDLKGKEVAVRVDHGLHLNGFLITDPGEYEVHGVSVIGRPVKTGGTLLRFRLDDLTWLYPLGLVAAPTPEEMQDIGSVDVLIVEAISSDVLDTLVQRSEASEVLISKAAMTGTLKLKSDQETANLKLDRRTLPEGEPVIVLLG